MKIARKITSIATLVLSGYVVLELILLLLGVSFLGGTALFFSILTLAVAGFFAINSLNMIEKNKTIGFVSLGLICLSALLIVIALCVDISGSLYLNLTISFGLLSVLFSIIVSSGLDLGKSNLAIQIIVYLLVFVTDVIATLGIFGVVDLGEIIVFFCIMILLCILGVVVLKVLAKRVVSKSLETEKGMVKISASEYEMLKEKAKKYDELMSKMNSKEI